MKRIVEEKLNNMSVRYRVETNRIFGFIPCKWHTDTFYDAEHDMTFEAVFDSISDAYIHIGLNREGIGPDAVISRKIVY
jgi:hypothetical protein